MTLTRAAIEGELVNRRGAWMVEVGLSNEADGVNSDLNSPIGYAVRQVGGSVSSLNYVTDADVATVDSADIDEMLDIAEFRLLRNIYGHYTAVDNSGLPASQSSDQFGQRILKAMQLLKEDIDEKYGAGESELETGSIALDFVQKGDDADLA